MALPPSPREILSIVFLTLYILQMGLALYTFISLMRAGFSWWKTSFLSLCIMIGMRIGAFIAEIVFVRTNYQNFSAIIASQIMLSAGYFGLLDVPIKCSRSGLRAGCVSPSASTRCCTASRNSPRSV